MYIYNPEENIIPKSFVIKTQFPIHFEITNQKKIHIDIPTRRAKEDIRQ